MKNLENQLDKILIIRNNKNFELTEEGNYLFENLKSAFGILNKNFTSINEEFIYDELTIGVRHYLSDFIFKDSIWKFINKYPNIHLNLKLYSKLDIKKYTDEFDILIDYEDYTNLIFDNSVKIKLCSLQNIFVCGKTMYNQFSNVRCIDEINDAKLISMCPNKRNGKFQQFCFKNDIFFTSVISVNDSILCKNLVKNNIGLCVLNKEAIISELVSGDLKQIKIKEKLFDDEIVLVHKSNKNIENIDKFIETIKNEYMEEEK